jgi:MFS family permease
MTFGLRLPPEFHVYAGFAIYSFSLGNIFPRLPDVMAAMRVEEGAFGLGLIGVPVGTLIALTFAAPVVERLGFRPSLLAAIPLMAVGYAIAVHAPGPLSFFFLLVPVGLLVGGTEVILNVEADRVEALIGRRIMSRAHSFWSVGFFGAGIAGAGMAQLGLSPQLHLSLIVPVSAIAVALLLGSYNPAPKRPGVDEEAVPLVARPTSAIMVLVGVTLSAMLMEGASIDWSALYMRQEFGATPFLSGFAVAVFAFSQWLMRFFADGFVERYSPAGVSRVLCCVTMVGILLIFFSPLPSLSLLGLALVGIGTSAIFPLAVSAAAQRTDRSAAVNVASLSQISFVAFLLGPPLLGFVIEHFGIRWAFGLGMPLVLLSLVMSGALGRKAGVESDSASAASSRVMRDPI